MKNLFLFLAFLTVSVSAVDCFIQYGKGWGRENDGTCSIAFDGSRSYPALSLIPSRLKEETYYKLSFDAELENLPLTIRFQEKNGSVTRFQGCPENTTGKQRFTFYFRTGKGKGENSSFALYPNPGKAGRGRIGNIFRKGISSLDPLCRLGINDLENRWKSWILQLFSAEKKV